MLLGLRIFISIYSIIFLSLSVYSYSDLATTTITTPTSSSSSEPPNNMRIGQWLLHITTWNYILSTIYFILVIAIGIRELVRERRQSHSSYSVISISPREYEDGDLTTIKPSSERSQREFPTPSAANPNGIPIILVDGKEILFSVDDSDYDDDDDFVDLNDDVISVGYMIPIFYRFTYCVFNVTGNLAVIIVLMYWTVLHDYDIPILMNLTSVMQIDASVVILFWFLLEIVFNDLPIHILHFVFPIVTTLVYFFAYIVYTMATGHAIYKSVNFLEKPGHAILFVVVLMIGIVLTQVVLYALGQAKCRIADKLNKIRRESVA